MDYQIQITESLQRVATVSADSEIEAIELVRRLYKEERLYLILKILRMQISSSKIRI